MLLLPRKGIGLSKWRAQAYNGASAISSEASGAVSVVRRRDRQQNTHTAETIHQIYQSVIPVEISL